MKIAFLASDKIALPILEYIIDNELAEVSLVMTKPDRAAKRGLKLTPTAVKERALELGLPVATDKPTADFLQRYQIERILVFAYGAFITEDVFGTIPTINIHPSLLPKYRGPSPIQTALLNGDKQTGVTLFFIEKEMDAGDIIYQAAFELTTEDNYASLAEQAVNLAKPLVKEMLQLDDGQLQTTAQPQDDSQATICSMIKKEDGRILAQDSPEQIHNKVRAIGGFVEREGKRIKLIETKLVAGSLHLVKVQMEGKNVVDYQEFVKAYDPLNIGEVHGT